MGMIQSRDLTTHTYDEATADQIASAVQTTYYKEFEELRSKLDELKQVEGKV